MQYFDIKPDEVLINSILDGCEKYEDYESGSKIFDYIKSLNVNIPSMAFSIMMKVRITLIN